MSHEPLKTLIVAFGCEPGRGSEPGVGWGFVDEASRRRPVWVLTHTDQKQAIDQYLATQHKHHPIHPIYVKLPALGWLWRSHFGINLYYYLWQLKAGLIARKLHRQVGFDLVHHVSFARYWMHSAGAMVGAPFVFGPVGGGENYPRAFWSELSPRERFREYYWAAVRRLMEHDPLVQRTFKAARAIIASGPFAVEQFARLGYHDVEQMSAVAPTPKLPPAVEGPAADDVFRFISIGRLPRWRGVHLGIRAFARAFGPTSGYTGRPVAYGVIGEGAELPRLKALARELGVADRVTFEGDLPYAQCLDQLACAGAMVHPALRDSAGVTFEALSLGVPVVCTDIGTPVLLVDETCGTIVPTADGPDDVVGRFAAVMRQWALGGEAYTAMRTAAVERAKAMSRQARGDRTDAIYRRVLAAGSAASARTTESSRPSPAQPDTSAYRGDQSRDGLPIAATARTETATAPNGRFRH